MHSRITERWLSATLKPVQSLTHFLLTYSVPFKGQSLLFQEIFVFQMKMHGIAACLVVIVCALHTTLGYKLIRTTPR